MHGANRKALQEHAAVFGVSEYEELEGLIREQIILRKKDYSRHVILSEYLAKDAINFHKFVFRVCASAQGNPKIDQSNLVDFAMVMNEVIDKYPDDPELSVYKTINSLQTGQIGESIVTDLVKAFRAGANRKSDTTLLYTLIILQLTDFEIQSGQEGLIAPQSKEIMEDFTSCWDMESIDKRLLLSASMKVWSHTVRKDCQARSRTQDSGSRLERLKFELNALGNISRKHLRHALYLRCITEIGFDTSADTINVRPALLHFAEDNEKFETYEDLLYALAVQSYLNGYSQDPVEEDFDALERTKKLLEHRIANESNDLVVDGIPDKNFIIKLAGLALYEPPHHVHDIQQVVSRVDLTKLNHYLAKFLKLTVLNKATEAMEIYNLVPVTAIEDTITYSTEITL